MGKSLVHGLLWGKNTGVSFPPGIFLDPKISNSACIACRFFALWAARKPTSIIRLTYCWGCFWPLVLTLVAYLQERSASGSHLRTFFSFTALGAVREALEHWVLPQQATVSAVGLWLPKLCRWQHWSGGAEDAVKTAYRGYGSPFPQRAMWSKGVSSAKVWETPL